MSTDEGAVHSPRYGADEHGAGGAGEDDELALTHPDFDARPMVRKKARPPRQWKRREKPSPCMMSNFPWETVFQHLLAHPRSLIMMQMVDKGLAWRLAKDHHLWNKIFRRHLYRCSHLDRQIKQTRFPSLKLGKAGLTGIPVHLGMIRGDPNSESLKPGFDEEFTAYVRVAFSLMHGPRCGLCGSRWHHEPYWSLGLRVCKLCMANNLITSWELLDRYGIHYADIATIFGFGRVFYYYQEFGAKQDRLPPHGALPSDLSHRRCMWVFWRPHLERLIDLPALYVEQKARKQAAAFLCGVMRRARALSLRRGVEKGPGGRRWYSIDKLVMELYRDERRSTSIIPWKNSRTDFPSIGGADWAFIGAPLCKKTRHEQRHGQPRAAFASFMFRWEDSGPFLRPQEPRV
jgi:hypothetical protein